MDVLDLVIIALGAVAAVSGYRRGLIVVVLSLGGLLIGMIVGAALAPAIAQRVAPRHASVVPLVGSIVFIIFVSVFEAVGTGIGIWVRRARLLVRGPIRMAEGALGALVGVIGLLAGAWYAGFVFSQSPLTQLDDQIQGSAIEHFLDGIFAPHLPGFLATITNLLRNSSLPNPFAGLIPQSPPPVPIPSSVDTPGVRTAAAATSKVTSQACDFIEVGSSWPIAPGYVVTNAHVVAGSSSVTVTTTSGTDLAATVVLYDPEMDVAVLHVPGLGLAPLPLHPGGDPPRGTQGAAIGYPGGGALQVTPAAVAGSQTFVGRDIYGNNLVSRDVIVLSAVIRPGDSGGPLVDTQGQVMGMDFAASTVNPDEGYTLSLAAITPDLDAGRTRTAAVSTQGCTT